MPPARAGRRGRPALRAAGPSSRPGTPPSRQAASTQPREVHIATEETPTPAPPADPLTFESALGHAARLLRHAELETNLPVMERLERLADSWIAIARTLTEAGS